MSSASSERQTPTTSETSIPRGIRCASTRAPSRRSAVRGIATINGKPVGEGVGAAALGHPLDALAWVANHLAAHGRGLVFRDVVITGSIITTKTVQPGDLVKFEVAGLGNVELRVD